MQKFSFLFQNASLFNVPKATNQKQGTDAQIKEKGNKRKKLHVDEKKQQCFFLGINHIKSVSIFKIFK